MRDLLLALLSIALWAILTFIRPLGVGVTHLLLGIGATLLVRWWALRNNPA
ncbi:MAG: hypothetical protein ABJC74_12170 [Gemmatimonadota bacterium]